MSNDDRARWYAIREQSRELLDAPAPASPPRDVLATDALQKWAAGMPQPDEPKPARKLDTMPLDIVRAEIVRAVAAAVPSLDAMQAMIDAAVARAVEDMVEGDVVEAVALALDERFADARKEIDALELRLRRAMAGKSNRKTNDANTTSCCCRHGPASGGP